MTLCKSDIVDLLIDSVAFVLADLDTGEIEYASRQAEELMGYYIHGELIHKPVEMLIPEAARAKHVADREAFARKPRTQIIGERNSIFQVQHADGHSIDVEIGLTASVIDNRRCVLAVLFPRTNLQQGQAAVLDSRRPSS
jgi:PAS domain S-box-containing protein